MIDWGGIVKDYILEVDYNLFFLSIFLFKQQFNSKLY